MSDRRPRLRGAAEGFESTLVLPTGAPASPRPESGGAPPRRARRFGLRRQRKGRGSPAGTGAARALLCAFALFCVPAAGASPEVVVSIKPIHALVAGVMGETGEPRLIVPGVASPHTYQMRPSEAAALHAADLVVWVDETLESFLADPIANLGSGAEILALHQVPGLRLLRNRSGGPWPAGAPHRHEDEHAADHHDDEHAAGHHEDEHAAGHHDDEHAAGHHEDEHAADGHHEDEHAAGHHDDEHAAGHHDDEHAAGHHEDEHAAGHHEDEHAADHHEDEHAADHHEDEHAAGHHDDHHGEFDMHIWLDPHNARRIVDAVAESLARLDPGHAATYRRNAAAMRARITSLEESLRARLAPVRSRAFIVFHDAYQYFERSFGLHAVGAVALGHARLPGAKRLSSLRRALVERDVRCLFVEPQFEPRLALGVVASTEVRIGTLDPLGADLAAGPEAWFELLRRMGDSFVECLGDA